MDLGLISAIGYGGFTVKLSAHELGFLRAAGIPAHILNNNDRACVIRALMLDNELIEDHKAGGYASLVYKMGSLRDMVELTDKEKAEQDIVDKADFSAEELQLMQLGYSKEEVLAMRRRRRQEEWQQINQRRLEMERAASTEEENRMRREALLFEQAGAARYAEMNPLPPVIIGILLAGQLGGIGNQVKPDDDGNAFPIMEKLQPDTTPSGRAASAELMIPQVLPDAQSVAMGSRSIIIQQPVMQQSLAEQPAVQEFVPADSPKLPFKIVLEEVGDNDPTHLKAPMPERKIQHELPALSLPHTHKSDK